MSFDHYVAIVSSAIAFLSLLVAVFGLVAVILQLRDAARERESDSLVKVYDINRELLSLGFSHPQLFSILQDGKNADPVWERRYLQLWLNQLSLLHSFLKRSVKDHELRESLEHNLSDFMRLENMRAYWLRYGHFYPKSFQKLVSGIIKKVEPPVAAQLKSGS